MNKRKRPRSQIVVLLGLLRALSTSQSQNACAFVIVGTVTNSLKTSWSKCWDSNNDPTTTTLCRRDKQIRRKPKYPRRPPNYWSDISNVEQELRLFWTSIDVPIDSHRPPPIPSELLLNYFERHDLRYAIAQHGGRQALSEWLGAALIPGPWRLAVQTGEVQRLLNYNNTAGRGLSATQSPYQQTFSSTFIQPVIQQQQFQQQRKKPKGFWTDQRILYEFYQYLEDMKQKLGRPSVWMPRMAELSEHGRDDLKQAIVRRYGTTNLKSLTPYDDWRYFESQLELFLELRHYLMTYHDYPQTRGRNNNNSPLIFPKLSDIHQHSPRLHDLIMEFGGRKMVANKVGVGISCVSPLSTPTIHTAKTQSIFQGMSYGTFDLDFGIELLTFVRNTCMESSCFDMMMENHNFQHSGQDRIYCGTSIQMPTTQQLLNKGEHQLVEDIHRFGGHENVARRLNLSFDQKEAQRNVFSSTYH